MNELFFDSSNNLRFDGEVSRKYKKLEIEYKQHCYDEPTFFMFDYCNLEKDSAKNYSFNPLTSTFSVIPKPPNPFKNSGIIIKRKNIYIFNGQIYKTYPDKYCDRVLSYSIETGKWDSSAFVFPSLKRKRSIVLDNPIYAHQAFQVGGITELTQALNSTVLYDFHKIQYFDLNFCPYNRNLIITKGASAMGVNFLFTWGPQAKCFIWDVRCSFKSSQLIEVPFLNGLRNDYSVTNSNYSLYFNGGTMMSCETSNDFFEFDTRNMEYIKMPNMPSKRSGHGSYVFEKKLYTMGGYCDSYYSNFEIDIYDFKEEKWEKDSAKLPCIIDCNTSVFNNNYFLF
uniref:Activin types I and II receptor domain-containing protein n=1 Tax=Strongyloides stercoralis TaxID=6248 RepID=A0A0K0E4T8_STRER